MSDTAKPNIVLILADDMGFADLGCTGSEIRTPNLDALARGGAMLTSMYNCARCCPTRASMLTGLYPHQAGIGHMGTPLGPAEYQGFLRKDAATIAEHLKPAGYQTFMAGKWHVGGDYDAKNPTEWRFGEANHPTPRQRGFDRFYGMLDGAQHFFSPHHIMEDDSRVTDLPEDFYFTDAITDKAIDMIEGAEEAPFFLYLAHTAPHWPLHAPPEDIARYEGVYNKGWDATRTARHEEMNGAGLLQTPWEISPRDQEVHAWNDEPNKDWEAAKMATYAAMVDRMDQSIGRLIAALKRLGKLDNTLILFLSDNGGCAEFMAEDGWAQYYPDVTKEGRKITKGNVPGLRPGPAETFQSYDKPWANVSNAPFRLFKHFVHEGGISTPLIAHWPIGFARTGTHHAACHVVDILPTILEVTGSRPITETPDCGLQPLEGESFLRLLQGAAWQREQSICFEHEGNAALRFGQFKLVRLHDQDWEFYDMEADRTELHDLRHADPKRAKKMIEEYQHWALRIGVQPWEQLLPKLLAAWQLSTVDG